MLTGGAWPPLCYRSLVTEARRLRADAGRNAERIVNAAREAFTEVGAAASLEEIAERAGVGVATLYRRFANKDELVRAVFEQRMAMVIEPAVEQARGTPDPRHGIMILFEAALRMAADEAPILAAARDAGAITTGAAARFFTPLADLIARGQADGSVRTDIEPCDLPRIMAMLHSTVRLVEPETEGWRRYLALLMDALSPHPGSLLPPGTPLPKPFQEGTGRLPASAECRKNGSSLLAALSGGHQRRAISR